MRYKRLVLALVFIWFIAGGIGHFAATDYFVKIIPPQLPQRELAVYLSGLFELIGALGLLHLKTRRLAGIGLCLLTIAVTPANVYMWLNPALFPRIPEILLALRLPFQVVLVVAIWWASSLGVPGARANPGLPPER
jgi:uncharacterized membrane protein